MAGQSLKDLFKEDLENSSEIETEEEVIEEESLNAAFSTWYDQLFALLLSMLPALSGALIFGYIVSRSYWGGQ